MFEFNPFEVGNPMTLGMIEEELVSDIDKMASASREGYMFTVQDVYNLLGRYNVSYLALPDWIKQKIDRIIIV
jgi:hypothetical protein